MSEIDRLQDAFLKADSLAQQGDAQAADDARAFAQEIRRIQSAGGAADQPQMMNQVNRGIADAAGGIVDFLNPFDQPHGLNPFPEGTGSARDGLTGAMEGAGIDVAQGDPQNAWQAFQRGVGEAAGSVVPIAKGAQVASKAPGMVGQIAGNISGSLSSTGGTAAEMLAGGMAAGAQRGAADAGAPEWLQNTAAIAAPMTIPLAAGAATKGPIGRLVKQGARSVTAAVAPYTEAGGREVARSRVQSLAGGADRADELAKRLNGDTETGLSPARQVGDENLIGLEDLAKSQDPNLRERMAAREARSRATAQGQIEGMGGDVDAARNFVAQRQKEFTERLQAKADATVGRAEQRMRGIGPDATEADNANAVMDEINRSLAQEVAEEKRLWDAVPKEQPVPTSTARGIAERIASETPRAQTKDIPNIVKELLLDETGFADAETVSEMHGLYSELRRVARSAMAGNDQNKNMARIANEIADGILEDLGATGAAGGAGRAINEARAFSTALHETFDRGAVGRLLKRTIDGDTAIDPELALQRTIGRGGETASVANRQILDATDGQVSKYAIEDYIKDRFSLAVESPTGDFTPKAARKFVRDNRALLEQYPDLRAEILGAVGQRDAAEALQARVADVVKASSQKQRSALAGFLDGPPEKAIDGIFTAQNPIRAARVLRNAVGKDGSGEALAGLKGAFADRLMDRAARSVGGKAEIDPNKLGTMVSDGPMARAMEVVFSPAEMKRLRLLSRELNALDAPGRNVGASLSGAGPNKLVEYMARVVAARQGAQMGGGGGGSLQTAQMASSRTKEILGRLVSDKAGQIIADAIEDPELMRMLLTDVGKLDLEKKVFPKFLPYMVGGAVGATQE